MGHLVEVFVANCPLCEETLKIVREAICPECSIKVYNLYEKCEDLTCVKKAEEYGVRAVPTIVVDGQTKIEGKPTLELMKRVLGT